MARSIKCEVQQILKHLAEDNTIAKTAQKFKCSIGKINNILSGSSHSEHSGITKDILTESKMSGLQYVHANKETFLNLSACKDAGTNTDVAEKSATTPKKDVKPSIKSTTQPTKEAVAPGSVMGSIDFGVNVDAIVNQSKAVVEKIDNRMIVLSEMMVEAQKEMETLTTQREQWSGVTAQFSPVSE